MSNHMWQEHVQKALVKETGWNDGWRVLNKEGCSLLEEMSVIPPFLVSAISSFPV